MSKYRFPQHLRKDEGVQTPSPANVPQHPLFTGEGSVGLMSAQDPFTKPEAPGEHVGLMSELSRMGLHFDDTRGHYNKPEKSVIVYNPTEDQMKELGRKYGQESVIFSPGGPGAQKNAKLIYTNGEHVGKFHAALPTYDVFDSPPENYYTMFPGIGYGRLHFDWDNKQDMPKVAPHTDPATQPTLEEAKKSLSYLRDGLKKMLADNGILSHREFRHPNSYEWHDGHTDHHQPALPVSGVPMDGHEPMMGAARNADPMPTPGLQKTDLPAPPAQQNDQAAGVGVSSYARFAAPYGKIQPGTKSDLFHYDYRGKLDAVRDLVKQHGYQAYYAGGAYGQPDLAAKNYNTGHLMIYDPTPSSGGDFGDRDYTDAWRQTHELAHALTYPELNNIYGEGRRIGPMGKHRSLREAMRAVHWEHLVTHKQRELSRQIGIEIPDHVFNREYNTVMHDALHRAVTGKFTEPSDEGFTPHDYAIPLDHAMKTLQAEASKMGLKGMDDTLPKTPRPAVAAPAATPPPVAKSEGYEPSEVKKKLADHIRNRIDSTVSELIELRDRELRKNDSSLIAHEDFAASAAEGKNMITDEKCLLCGVPGECLCLAKANKDFGKIQKSEGKVRMFIHDVAAHNAFVAKHYNHVGWGYKKDPETKKSHPHCETCNTSMEKTEAFQGDALSKMNKDYTHFVVTPESKIHSGWEYKEDAHDALADGPSGSKVYHRRTLASKGIDPEKKEHWHTDKKSEADMSKGSHNFSHFAANAPPKPSTDEQRAAAGKPSVAHTLFEEGEPKVLHPSDRKKKVNIPGIKKSFDIVSKGEPASGFPTKSPEEGKAEGAVLPGDKDPKKVPAEGSGGDVKEGKKLDKAGMSPNAQPAKPPGGGSLGAPKPPAPMVAKPPVAGAAPAGAPKPPQMGKAEPCMKCGEMHQKLDKCGESMDKAALRPNVGTAPAAALHDAHRAAVNAVQAGPGAPPKVQPRPPSDFDANAFRPVPAGAAKVQIPGLKPPPAKGAPSATAKPSGFDPSKVRMGKSETFIKTCAICMKAEHSGICP